MNIMNIKQFFRLVVLQLGLAALTFASMPAAAKVARPQLPAPASSAPCSNLKVPQGNKEAFHVYARGVQIYKWNGTSWSFVAPEANLYATPFYLGKVGTHYAGPTWEGIGGSKVVGTRQADCTPDPNAIPWLLLKTASTSGRGLFSRVTYIQRVNTVGGLAPTTPGSFIGAEARVPYTAQYYFFRSKN